MLTALQFLGSADSGIGLPSIARWAAGRKAKMKATTAEGKNAIEGLTSGIDIMQLQANCEQKMKEAKTDDERANLTKEMEKATAENMLKVLWTTLVVDITSTIHETVQMVLFDQAVDIKTRKLRAEGLKAMGQTFIDCPEPPRAEGEEKMDAKAMYEEAAFKAMLETMKNKDEAQFRASTTL